VAGLNLRTITTLTRRGKYTPPAVIALVVGRGRLLLVREGTMHPGNVLAGSINHLGITLADQPVGPREIAGIPAPVRHLAHRHRLEVRVRRGLNMRRVNTAIDKVVL
jgi:hypothetical protein